MLIGFSLVKNEADIIEPFVRHNLQFLDFLVVGDNGSSDNTRVILLALQAEGLPIAVFDDPIFAYSQSQKMTRIAQSLYSALRPDFLFPLDADEFLACSSRQDLVSALRSVPERGIGLIPWVSHVISPSDLSAGEVDPPRTMRFRRRVEVPQYYKVVLRGGWDGALGFSIDQGSHSVSASPGVEIRQRALENVALAHFPVRSSGQLATKAILGWMAYLGLNANAAASGAGYQWRDNFTRLIARGGIDTAELPERSMLYAQTKAANTINWGHDIVPSAFAWDYTRRYRGLAARNPLVEVARAWENTFTPVSTFTSDSGRSRNDPIGSGTHSILDVPPMSFIASRFHVRTFYLLDNTFLSSLQFLQSFHSLDVRVLGQEPASNLDGHETPTALCLDYATISLSGVKKIFTIFHPEVVLIYASNTSDSSIALTPTLVKEGLNTLTTHGYVLDQKSSVGFRAVASSAPRRSALMFIRRQRFDTTWFANGDVNLRLDVQISQFSVKAEEHLYAFQS